MKNYKPIIEGVVIYLAVITVTVTIIFNFLNNLWMTRGEYDGSEWWVICRRPPLPKKDKS